MEIARGTAGDRPWAELFAEFAFWPDPCELIVEIGMQFHRVAFAHEAVVWASSPLAADSALRVALTYNVVTTALMPAIAQRVATSPSTDPIDVLAAVAKLSPETTLLLRRRTIAIAATRIFALAAGTYKVTTGLSVPVLDGTAIDVRALIYEGVRTHVSPQQQAAAIAVYGTAFSLHPDAEGDVSQFGFSAADQPVIEELRAGATLDDLIQHHPDVNVLAIVDALLAARALSELAVKRTSGQFSTRAPVTGRFAARASGTFSIQPEPEPEPELERSARTTDQQPAMDLEGAAFDLEEPALDLADDGFPRRTMEQPAVDWPEGLDEPTAAEEPLDLSDPRLSDDPGTDRPRKFTTTPPVTGSFSARMRSETQPDPPPLRQSGQFTIPDEPAPIEISRPTRQSGQFTVPDEPPPIEISRPTRQSGQFAAQRGSGQHAAVELPPAPPTRQSGQHAAIEAPRRGGGEQPAIVLPQAPAARPHPALDLPRVGQTEPPRPRPSPTQSSAPHPALDVPRRPNMTTPRPHPALDLPQAKPSHPALEPPRPATRPTQHPALDPRVAPRQTQTPPARPTPIPTRPTPVPDPRPAKETPVSTQPTKASVNMRTPKPLTQSPIAPVATPQPPQVQKDTAAQRYERGVTLMATDMEKAVIELHAAAKMSGDVDHLAVLAWAQFCVSPDRAAAAKATKAALAKAIYQSTSPEIAHFYLGRLERMLGRDKEALGYFRTVVDLVPRHVEALAEIRMLEARLNPRKK